MTLENDHAFGELRGEINVTPLIDILLVLLIIFMVITPVVPHGLGAALPKRSMQPDLRTETPIIVQIASDRNGTPTFKINQDNVSTDELAVRLGSIFSVRADKVLFVKGDDNIDFSTIARVMDIGKGAGAEHIGLLTSRDTLRN